MSRVSTPAALGNGGGGDGEVGPAKSGGGQAHTQPAHLGSPGCCARLDLRGEELGLVPVGERMLLERVPCYGWNLFCSPPLPSESRGWRAPRTSPEKGTVKAAAQSPSGRPPGEGAGVKVGGVETWPGGFSEEPSSRWNLAQRGDLSSRNTAAA